MTEEEKRQSHRNAVKKHGAKYRAITIRPTKEQAHLIFVAAESAGMSVSAYVLRAVCAQIERNE